MFYPNKVLTIYYTKIKFVIIPKYSDLHIELCTMNDI